VKNPDSARASYFIVSCNGAALHTSVAEGGISAGTGDVVEFDGGRIESVEEDPGYAKAVEKDLAAFCKGLFGSKAHKYGNADIDAVTSRLWVAAMNAGKLLARKIAYCAPIIVRFHNDADGSGGALALNCALRELVPRIGEAGNIVWMMQKGVSYSAYDAANDMLIANGYSSMEKPLLIIIDFGTTTQSNAGIRAVDGKFDVIWLDHHPIVDGFEGAVLGNYINPWNYGGNSNYTAGLLASVFAKTFSDADTGLFERASLIGDYSEYAPMDDAKAQQASMLLDFITSDLQAAFGPSKQNVTPQEIMSVLSDRKRRKELLDYANIRLEEAVERGMDAARMYEAPGAFVYLLDFDVVKSGETRYPLPGRFASKLLARINGTDMRRAIVVLYVGAYIMMRADKELCTDLNILDVIAEVKRRYGNDVENGGGHRCAGAVKLADKSRSREVAIAIVRIIKNAI
jgi:RecJ-like exonuclease